MRSELVVLGLGSNQGKPIENLRRALNEIKKSKLLSVVDVSSIYESEAQTPENSAVGWQIDYLNAAVLCRFESSVQAEDLLSEIKQIEKRIGRVSAERWAPRIIDIDILYWSRKPHQSEQVSVPHKLLSERPFALLPLLEVYPQVDLNLPSWSASYIEAKPFNTRKSRKYFWPKMVGILNITQDSFSDGGLYLNEGSLHRQYQKLVDQGAEIIDIGAESTRPGAKNISSEDEFNKLSWALDVLKSKLAISLDSRKSEVVEKILNKFSIQYLNDVQGFSEPQMVEHLKKSNLKAFVMHSLSVPPSPQNILNTEVNPCDQLTQWWKIKLQNLLESGISENNLIFDPGIGFGKSKIQNHFILHNLHLFTEIKNEIMVAHSRKSFLELLSDRSADLRDLETALVTQKLNLAYTQYLRVHDVESQVIALRSRAV